MITIFARTALSQRSLKDEVREQLREAIISCRLKPGARIVETEVARSLGISQVPVREALRGLEEEGLVRSIKNKGSFVTEIDEREMYHIFSLRTTIECNALDIVMPELTEGQLSELEQLVDAMRSRELLETIESGIDVNLHFTIVRWSQVQIYVRTWGMLNGHIRRFIAYTHPVLYDRETIAEQHEALVEALRRRDIQNAKEVFRHHIMRIWDEGASKNIVKVSPCP